MKKLLVIIFILCSSFSFAKTTVIDRFSLSKDESYKYSDRIYYRILCIGGYKYLTTYTLHSYSSAHTIQMYQIENGDPRPIRCNSNGNR